MEKVWLYAALGGFVPTLFWLYFWLKEDTNLPEPRRLIARTFIFGTLAAFFSLAIQAFLSQMAAAGITSETKVIIFAAIEEICKYGAVFIAALNAASFNERIDPMIYMITAALGFVAIENMFYIIDYIDNLEYLRSLIDGGYRFIGATLVHTVSSSMVGIFIAMVFFQKKIVRRLIAWLGLAFAVVFHAGFNFLVLSGSDSQQKIAFYSSWFLIVVVLIFFEYFNRDRRIRPADY